MTEENIRVVSKSTLCEESFSLFNQLKELDKLCDVTLITEGGNLRAHKLVLSSGSPYFCTMFTSSVKEADMDEISIPDISYDTMEKIIHFIYTSELKISTETAQNLQVAANLLQMTLLVDMCGDYMMKNIDAENCFTIRALMVENNCDEEIVARANDYINSDFLQIVQNDSFLQLDVGDVVELLSRSELCCVSEADVFRAAVRWLEASDERKQYSQRILQCIRSNLLSNHLSNNALFHITEPLNTSEISRVAKTSLLAITSDEDSSALILYDSTTKQWKHIMEVENKWYYYIAASKDHIFVSGSADKGKKEVYYVLDRKTKIWASLGTKYHYHSIIGMVTVGKKLYVFKQLSETLFVSIIDIDSKQWTRGPEIKARCGYSRSNIVALDNDIYVIQTNHKGECQKLDTETNQWSVIAPMTRKRGFIGGVATYKGKIYVAGGYGRFSEGYVNTFEVYDPITNSWKELKPMPIACSPKLVGTTDGIYAFLNKSVSFYDVARDMWSEVNCPENVSRLAITALPDLYQD